MLIDMWNWFPGWSQTVMIDLGLIIVIVLPLRSIVHFATVYSIAVARPCWSTATTFAVPSSTTVSATWLSDSFSSAGFRRSYC